MSLTSAKNSVNKQLVVLGHRYHDGLALAEIDAILTSNGFNAMEEAIYCGRDGRSHEQVGEKTWLTMSWHKMDVSGLYEVTAYVS